MACIAITGIAGFIGSALARELSSRGHLVWGLDDYSSGARQPVTTKPPYLVRKGDVYSDRELRRLCHGADFVLHHAAVASVSASWQDPWQTHRTNVDATLRLLMIAREAGVQRVVFASSAAVYGNAARKSHAETDSPDPVSPYGLHKLIGEKYMKMFSVPGVFETISLRYFNVYGSGQNPHGPYAGCVARVADRLRNSMAPEIYGSGTQTRDFVHVTDVVRANLRAMYAPGVVVSGEAFNIGTGQEHSVLQVVEKLIRKWNCGPGPILPLERRASDVQSSCADLSKTRRCLGWEPTVDLDSGLEEVMEGSDCWYPQKVADRYSA